MAENRKGPQDPSRFSGGNRFMTEWERAEELGRLLGNETEMDLMLESLEAPLPAWVERDDYFDDAADHLFTEDPAL